MPEETDVNQPDPKRSVSRNLPGVLVSRVIEYLSIGGETTIARDCTYDGNSYSKGATISMPGSSVVGAVYECTGDKDGSWKFKSGKTV
jgi:hypothetical protein